MILSTLAHLSSGEFGAANSFQAGLQAIQSKRLSIVLSPREVCNLKTFEAALGRNREGKFEGEENKCSTPFVHAWRRMANATLRELELLRVVSDTLGCPMPPILDLQKD